MKATLGEFSAPYAQALGGLGECLRLNGKLEQAGSLLEKALGVQIAVLGATGHVAVLETRVSAACLLIDLGDVGDMEQAKRSLERELLFEAETLCGATHPLCAYIKANIGLCVTALGKFNPSLSTSIAQDGEEPVEGGDIKRVGRALGGSDNDSTVFGSGASTLKKEDDSVAVGQKMIDAALLFFDKYEQCPFSDEHPWVLRFGGWSLASSVGGSSLRTPRGGGSLETISVVTAATEDPVEVEGEEGDREASTSSERGSQLPKDHSSSISSTPLVHLLSLVEE